MANKQDIVNAVAEVEGIKTKKQATEVVEAVFAEMTKLIQGLEVDNKKDTLYISGIGKFRLTESKARKGHNPQKPEEKIDIPAKIRVSFKAGKPLKDSVNK